MRHEVLTGSKARSVADNWLCCCIRLKMLNIETEDKRRRSPVYDYWQMQIGWFIFGGVIFFLKWLNTLC